MPWAFNQLKMIWEDRLYRQWAGIWMRQTKSHSELSNQCWVPITEHWRSTNGTAVSTAFTEALIDPHQLLPGPTSPQTMVTLAFCKQRSSFMFPSICTYRNYFHIRPFSLLLPYVQCIIQKHTSCWSFVTPFLMACARFCNYCFCVCLPSLPRAFWQGSSLTGLSNPST